MASNGPSHNEAKDFMEANSNFYESTEGSRLMRISLVRISLLRFFKTMQKYLAYAFLGLFTSLLQFSYVLG
jgi:hypothetical protein